MGLVRISDKSKAVDSRIGLTSAIPTGKNEIGKIGANPGTEIGAVGLVAGQSLASVDSITKINSIEAITGPLPEGESHLGATSSVGGRIHDETGTTRTIQRTFLDTSSSGDTQVVAAQGIDVVIRVLAVNLVAAGTVNVRFRSGTTSITSLKVLSVSVPLVMPMNEHGWFQTAANQALNLNLSTTVAVGCEVVWCQAS